MLINRHTADLTSPSGIGNVNRAAEKSNPFLDSGTPAAETSVFAHTDVVDRKQDPFTRRARERFDCMQCAVSTPHPLLDEQSHQHLSPMTPSSNTNLIHNPKASAVQHKSNRLAEKAKSKNCKHTLQISQELVQRHFANFPRISPGNPRAKQSQNLRTLISLCSTLRGTSARQKMEAIKALIEVGTKQQKKKSDNNEAAVGEAMLMA